MKRARLSDQAKSDIGEIWRFIGAENPAAADKVIDALIDRSNSLVEFPAMGRQREELRAGVRNIGVGSYSIFYRRIPDGIAVLRVLHEARDIQALFGTETAESLLDEHDT